ncbi:MAG: hypothetical protein J5524_02060 [Bacteroidaceae bacterium]|nr:hypothetical protein [Bacteroidaceae bacterium]
MDGKLKSSFHKDSHYSSESGQITKKNCLAHSKAAILGWENSLVHSKTAILGWENCLVHSKAAILGWDNCLVHSKAAVLGWENCLVHSKTAILGISLFKQPFSAGVTRLVYPKTAVLGWDSHKLLYTSYLIIKPTHFRNSLFPRKNQPTKKLFKL